MSRTHTKINHKDLLNLFNSKDIHRKCLITAAEMQCPITFILLVIKSDLIHCTSMTAKNM